MNIKTIALTIILAFQATSTMAGTISQSGKWVAYKDKKHFVWQKPSCRAFTANHKNRAMLEVFSEKRNGQYIEPTVQLSTTKGYADFYRAKLVITANRRKHEVNMFAVSRSGMNRTSRAAVVQISDRERVVSLLKAGSAVEITFYGKRKNFIKKTKFSLSGSSASINSVFANCGLRFNTIDL